MSNLLRLSSSLSLTIDAVSSLFHIIAGRYRNVRTLAPEHGRDQHNQPHLDLRVCLNADLFNWHLREQNHMGSYHALKLFMLYSGKRDLGSLRHAVEMDRLTNALESTFVRRKSSLHRSY